MSSPTPELKETMGNWLEKLAPWDVYATYTFAGPPNQAKRQIWGQRLSRSAAVQGRWHGVSAAGALYWMRRHLAVLETLLNGSVPERPSRKNGFGYVEDPQLTLPRSHIFGFLAVEEGGMGGLVHLHALLSGTGGLIAYCGERLRPGEWSRRCCMTHAWPCGYARVLPYDPSRGASHYVSKYVTKQLAEWELWGPAPQGPALD